MKIRMKLQRESGFNIILRLEVHLEFVDTSCQYIDVSKIFIAYVDKLMNIFDVDLVASYSSDEIHEPQLNDQRIGELK